MNGAIESLFCSNPDLSHRVYTYCKANPEFMETEAEYDALLQSLEQTLGYARMAGDRGLLPALLRPAGTSLLSLWPGPASRGSLGAGAGMIGWGILQQGSAPLPSQPFPSFVGAGPRPAHGAATWGRPYGFTGALPEIWRAGEDTRPYSNTGMVPFSS